MNIKTKFDVGDECWVMVNNKPTCLKIIGLYVTNNDSPEGIFTTIEYSVGSGDSARKYCENKLFATKEELIDKLRNY